MDSNEARATIERAHLIATLQEHPGWDALATFVQEQASARRRRVVTGACASFEDYRHETGWLEGAVFVLTAAETTEEHARRARPTLNRGA